MNGKMIRSDGKLVLKGFFLTVALTALPLAVSINGSAADHQVEVLTIYAFSSENWRRSAEEISDLTALMRFYLERESQA